MQSPLIEALSRAGPEDLEQVTKEIALRENDLASLKLVERFLRAKLGAAAPPPVEKPPREPRQGKKATPAETLASRKAMAVLLGAEGCLSVAVLCSRMGVPDHKIYYFANHEWFSKTSQGIHLTPAGRQANC